MNDAAELLKDRSRTYLLRLGFDVEQNLTRSNATDAERRQAAALGRALFTQVNALLKTALDASDLPTFTSAEEEWAKIFVDALYEGEINPETLDMMSTREAAVRELVHYRETLWLGLAMWAAHLHVKQQGERPQQMRVDALRIISQRFATVEDLLATFERASEGEEEDRLPWSDWFLSELPAGEGHWIPTRQELLFAMVLLTVALTPDMPPTPAPKGWLTWRYDEVTSALQRLDDEASLWSVLIPGPLVDTGLRAPNTQSLQWWHDRVAAVRNMFQELKTDTEANERAKLRDAPLDPKRVADFRSHLLQKTRESRLFQNMFKLHGGLQRLDAPPTGHTAMVSRLWMPKSFFTHDSRVVGLDMAANDLARVTANSEITQLLATLREETPRQSDEPLSTTVSEAIQELIRRGRRPSLIVIPIGWELRRSLGIQGWRSHPEPHPLIPLGRQRDFEGIIDDVPVIDLPHVPKDRLWVLDLAAATRYSEWPGDDDNSGIHFQLTSFDAETATIMLAKHPEVRAEGHTDEQAVNDLQERILLSLTLCWQIDGGNPDAAITIAVPSQQQRE